MSNFLHLAVLLEQVSSVGCSTRTGYFLLCYRRTANLYLYYRKPLEGLSLVIELAKMPLISEKRLEVELGQIALSFDEMVL